MSDDEIVRIFYPMDTCSDNERLIAIAIGRAIRRSALEECWEAVHAERLTDPTDSADDIAYNVAVQDCENAIRALAASSDGGKS